MKITVTQKDIDLSMSKALESEWISHRCPIALAVKAKLGLNDGVTVGRSHVCVGEHKYLLSKPAISFTSHFDNRKPVQPSTFVLKFIY